MKTKIVSAGLALLTLGLAACATAGASGEYTVTAVAPDVVRVAFRANGEDLGRAQDLVLLRAAELSLQANCPYFGVLSKRNHAKTQSSTRTSSSETIGFAGAERNYEEHTEAGDSASALASSLVVQFFREKPQDMRVSYEASSLVDQLKQKYGLQ